VKRYQFLLAAKLLRRAADEFGNHGCNDFDLYDDAQLSYDDACDFAREAGKHNRESEEETKDRLRNVRYSVPDFEAMEVLAALLGEEAGAARWRSVAEKFRFALSPAGEEERDGDSHPSLEEAQDAFNRAVAADEGKGDQ